MVEVMIRGLPVSTPISTPHQVWPLVRRTSLSRGRSRGLVQLHEGDELVLLGHDVGRAVEVDVIGVQHALGDADGGVHLELLLDLLQGVPARGPRGDRAERAAAAAAAADLHEPVDGGVADGGDLLHRGSGLGAEEDVLGDGLAGEGLLHDLLDVDVALPLHDAVDPPDLLHKVVDPRDLGPVGRGELPGARTAGDELHALPARREHGRLPEHPLEVDPVHRVAPLHHAGEGRRGGVEPEVVVA
jgi:hypothetical protein